MNKLIRSNVIVEAYRRTLRLMPHRFRVQSRNTLIIIFLNSLMELFGLASIIPIISVVVKENAIQETEILLSVYRFLEMESEESFLLFLCAVFLAIILFKTIFYIYTSQQQGAFAYGLFVYFSTRLQRYFYSKGVLYFKNTNSNKVVRDVNSICFRFAANMVTPMLNIVNEALLFSLIVISLLVTYPQTVLLLAIMLGPVSVIFFQIVKRRIQSIEERVNELNALTSMNLFQSIHGYVDVMINNRSEHFFGLFQQNVAEMKDMRTKAFVYKQMPAKILELGLMVGIVLLIIYGMFIEENSQSLAVTLGVMAIAAFRILPSVNRIIVNTLSVKGHMYVFDVIEQSKDLELDHVEQVSLSFKQEFKLENISFSYPDRQEKKILDAVSFEIQKGQRIGLVGASGSGKTTVLNIILGLIPQNEGKIYVDGTPLGKEHMEAWWDKIGYVQQDVYLIDGTLAENVAFGSKSINQEKLQQALHLANLTEVVATLPKGAETMIGERGAQLSGGQRQRVGIARALYGNAEILCFDEATSALDHQTEKEITESINSLSKEGFTMLIIAHRISTLRHCDKIIELEEGKVKAITTYDDLVTTHT